MANPAVTVDPTFAENNGYVRLQWTNANKGLDWYAWRVYRRLNGTPGWTLLKEYLVDQANYDFHDMTVPQNTPVDYSVVRVHLVATVPTEEAHTPNLNITAAGTGYWLVDPYTEAQSVKCYSVIADTFTTERDLVFHNMLGRGRKADRGTTWGVKGNMTVQLREIPGSTARAQLKKLQLLCEDPDFIYLKNPFGDVYKIVPGDPNVTRVAGVGMNEYVDATMDYTEVA